MKRLITILFLAIGLFSILGTNNLKAQIDTSIKNVKITVVADSVVQSGNLFYLRYTYQYTDSTDAIATHKLEREENNDGLKVLGGPYTSTAITSKSTNGKTKTEHKRTYTFVLSLDKEGRYKMPTLRIKTTSGKEIISAPFMVRATKEYVPKKGNTSAFDRISQSNGNASEANRSKIMTVDAIVSRKSITLGDSIECEIVLYTDKDLATASPTLSLPISSAYWKEHKADTIKVKEMKYKKDYWLKSMICKRFTITPMQAGEIILEPIELTVSYYTRDTRAYQPFDPFADFFKIREIRDTIIKTKRIRIKVEDKEIPTEPFVLDGNHPTRHTGIILDRSSSLMARSDSLAPTFLEIQNQFLKKLLNNKKAEEYSLTLFAGKAHYPKLTNTESILKLQPSKENDGSAIYNAILAAALRDGALTTEQNKARLPYSILLLTDGGDNSSYLSEKTLTNILLQHNIRVDVVAFASKKDTLYYPYNDSIIKINNRQDFSDVERIAKNTNGEFILVENKGQIPDAIRRIKEKIAKREPSKQQPEDSFKPNEAILHRLYKKIIKEAESDF